jgi:hypothetical protein
MSKLLQSFSASGGALAAPGADVFYLKHAGRCIGHDLDGRATGIEIAVPAHSIAAASSGGSRFAFASDALVTVLDAHGAELGRWLPDGAHLGSHLVFEPSGRALWAHSHLDDGAFVHAFEVGASDAASFEIGADGFAVTGLVPDWDNDGTMAYSAIEDSCTTQTGTLRLEKGAIRRTLDEGGDDESFLLHAANERRVQAAGDGGGLLITQSGDDEPIVENAIGGYQVFEEPPIDPMSDRFAVWFGEVLRVFDAKTLREIGSFSFRSAGHRTHAALLSRDRVLVWRSPQGAKALAGEPSVELWALR